MKILDLRKVRLEPPSITLSAHTSKYRYSALTEYRDSNSPVVTDRECLLLCPGTQCLLAHPSICETPPVDIILPCPPSHPCSLLAGPSTTTSARPLFYYGIFAKGKTLTTILGCHPLPHPWCQEVLITDEEKPFWGRKGLEAYSKFDLWRV